MNTNGHIAKTAYSAVMAVRHTVERLLKADTTLWEDYQ